MTKKALGVRIAVLLAFCTLVAMAIAKQYPSLSYADLVCLGVDVLFMCYVIINDVSDYKKGKQHDPDNGV